MADQRAQSQKQQETKKSHNEQLGGFETSPLEATPPVHSIRRRLPRPDEPLTPANVLMLQRMVGNQATARLLAHSRATERPRVVHARFAMRPANDRYEQEADRVANTVLQRRQAEDRPHGGNAERNASTSTKAAPAVQPSVIPVAILQRQAAARPPLFSDGGTLAATTEQNIRSSLGRGKALDKEARARFEGAMGADFAQVRIHTDAKADSLARSLDARAFTTGSDIFFRDGEYQPGSSSGQTLLAHELTHVVQQGHAAPNSVQRTPAHLVVQRWPWSKKKSKAKDVSKGKSKDKGKEKIDVDLDELTNLDAFINAGSKSDDEEDSYLEYSDIEVENDKPITLTKAQRKAVTALINQKALQDASTFEERLGRYLFNHPRANHAAAIMVDRMISALIHDFKATNDEHQKQIVQAFGAPEREKGGKPVVESAGQVGTDFDAVWGALREGNLRERMTALMNAVHGSFKQTLLDLMNQSKWNEMAARGLDPKKLKRRKRQLRLNPGAIDLFRDPDNPLDRKKLRTYSHIGTTRDEVGKTSERTVGDLEEGPFSIGLSQRERAYQFGDMDDEEINEAPLQWQEGATRWRVRDNKKWIKKVRDKLHMPVVAGPSGTALRMFQAWEYLNRPVPAADWRLALLAWMLTSRDHSFHEIMMISAEFGLPYTPGLRAYRHIEPLSEEELRNFVAVDRTFPDEWAFLRSAKAGNYNLVTQDHLEEARDLKVDMDALHHRAYELSPGERSTLLALISYTSEDPAAYKFINNALKGGVLTPKFYKFIKEDEYLKEKYEKGEFNIKQLISESRELGTRSMEAINMVQSFEGTVWRGWKTFSLSSLKKGKIWHINKLLSTSKSKLTAKRFTKSGVGRYRILAEIESKTGRDISVVSEHKYEGEVVFPPGTQLRVTEAPGPKNFEGIRTMKLEEVESPNAKQEQTNFTPGKFSHIKWDHGAEMQKFDALTQAVAPKRRKIAKKLEVYLNVTMNDEETEVKTHFPFPLTDPNEIEKYEPYDDFVPNFSKVILKPDKDGYKATAFARTDELLDFMAQDQDAPSTSNAPLELEAEDTDELEGMVGENENEGSSSSGAVVPEQSPQPVSTVHDDSDEDDEESSSDIEWFVPEFEGESVKEELS